MSMDVYVEEDRTKPLNWDFPKDQQQNIEAEKLHKLFE